MRRVRVRARGRSTAGVIATGRSAMASSASLTERAIGKVADDFSVQLVDYYGIAVTSELATTTCEIDPVSTTVARATVDQRLGVFGDGGQPAPAAWSRRAYVARVTCSREVVALGHAPLDLPVRISACFPGSERS